VSRARTGSRETLIADNAEMRHAVLILAVALLATTSARAAVYVSNPGAGQIAQVSNAGAPLTPATLAAPSAGPLASTADGTRLYAATTGTAGNASILGFAVHGNGTLEALGTTPVGGANTGGSLAVAGNALYFAASSGAVYQFTILADGSLQPKLVPSVSVPNADGIVVSPDGSSAYVTESGSTALAQFSIAAGTLVPKLVPTVTVGADPHPQPVVAPDGDVYVLLGSSGKLLELAPDVTGALSPLSPASVDVTSDPDSDIALSADGLSLYVSSCAGCGKIAEYDVQGSGQVGPKSVGPAGLGGTPVHLAGAPDNGRLYVADGSVQNAVEVVPAGAGGALGLPSTTPVFAPGAGRPGDILAPAPETGGTPTPTPTPTASATPSATPTAAPTATATPTPTATPSVEHKVARLGRIGRRAEVRHRRARVKVACRAGGATCQGILRLRRGGRRVGKRAFTIRSGRRATVRVRLRRRSRHLLAGARHGHLRVRARAAAGASHASRRIVLLRRRRG
jgi:hypothetical protein